jgi:hypothetical protein
MQRVVEPEWLDALPPDDPRAVQSRRDLRRINWLMGHLGILQRALMRVEGRGLSSGAKDGRVDFAPEVQRVAGAQGRGSLSRSDSASRSPHELWPGSQWIVELGAGDGTFLLRLARVLARRWPQSTAVLVERQPVVADETKAAFRALGWEMEVVAADVFDWLARPDTAPADLIIANLFLHHFREEQLIELFRQAANRTRIFLACEPRRSALALQASRMLGWIGCNDVTQHDAVISVRAGFVGCELSALWPEDERWQLQEEAAGLFSHCFVAQRC